MLEQASIDIGKAMHVESRRRTDEVRLNDLIHQIDELLWELEGLNLRDRPTVPDELLPRITLLVAEATQGPPPRPGRGGAEDSPGPPGGAPGPPGQGQTGGASRWLRSTDCSRSRAGSP